MIVDLLQEMIKAIGSVDLPIYMLDSLSDEERIIINTSPLSSQTDRYVSNDTIFISVILDKLSANGKSIHDINRIDTICSTILNHVMNYDATNKMYNITFLGKPIVYTEEHTDKSEAIIRLQITTKTKI